MIHIDLDIAHDDFASVEAACDDLVFRSSEEDDPIRYVVIEASGPGGGWPVVRFQARTPHPLWTLCKAYADDDEDEASELMDRAVSIDV